MSRHVWRPLAIVAAVAGVWALLHVGWYAHFHKLTDVPLYEKYGRDVVLRHEVPYRDFRPEYPPAALPAFIVPALFERSAYVDVFEALMATCLAAAALAVLAAKGFRAALATAVLPLVLGSVVVARFDLWPTALAVLAVATLLDGRVSLSAVLTGTGFAAKLWPALLVPLALVWIARRRGRDVAGRWLAIAAATAAVWFVPFIALAPEGVAHSFERQLGRPLQIETLGASILLLAHRAFGTRVGYTFSYGSYNIAGHYAQAFTTASTAIELVGLAAVYLWFLRSRASSADLVRCFAAVTAIAIVFGKVFSPQFLIWLFPLVPIVRRRRGTVATALLFLACALTQLYFPSHYKAYAQYFYVREEVDVFVRNLAVVALAAVLAWPPGGVRRLRPGAA